MTAPRGFFLTTIALLGICRLSILAQNTVPLRIDMTKRSYAGQTLFCDKNFNCGLFENENSKVGNFDKEDIPIQVWRDGVGFLIAVDSDGDRDLADEKQLAISPGATIRVGAIKRPRFGRPRLFPFEITHSRVERRGRTVDNFSIVSHYVATGTFRHGRCSARVILHDLDHDGNFDLADSTRGTNLGIDVNNDGKFWGKEEFHKASEILEICKRSFTVSALTNSRISFSLTPLKLAKVGETVPSFSFTLVNGKRVTSQALKGKSYVLDFWASWCVPCVEALPEMGRLKRSYGDRVEFYSINVDTRSRKKLAEGIIGKYELRDFSSVRMQGDADPLWKVFGGMNLNRLSIPLYVLVDSDGVVRYADNGGEGLVQLKENIEKINKK